MSTSIWIADLSSEIWDLRSQISDLRSQMWDVRSEMSDLRCQTWDLRSDISDLRSQICDLRSAISDLRSQISRFRIQSLDANTPGASSRRPCIYYTRCNDWHELKISFGPFSLHKSSSTPLPFAKGCIKMIQRKWGDFSFRIWLSCSKIHNSFFFFYAFLHHYLHSIRWFAC